jgi:hypothetical protein
MPGLIEFVHEGATSLMPLSPASAVFNFQPFKVLESMIPKNLKN